MKGALSREDSRALKGAAILMMVFHHCFREEDKFADYQISFAPFSMHHVVTLAAALKICVGIFALISGYGLMYSLKKERERQGSSTAVWVKRHLLSTLSGFWLLALLSYGLIGLLAGEQFQRWGETFLDKVLTIGIDILGLSGLMDTKSLNGTWWYMGTAVVFILAAPFLAEMIRRLGGSVSLAVILALPRVTGMGFQGGRSAMSFLMAFAVGMVCCHINAFEKFHRLGQKKGSHIGEGLKCLLLFLVVCVGMWLYPKISMTQYWEYHYALVPFLVSLFLVEYAFRIPVLYRILSYLGIHSMNIWLIHTFIRNYMGRYVWHFSCFLIAPLLILLGSLALSIVLEAGKKHLGYERWIGSLQQKVK